MLYLASDHGGFELKEKVKSKIEQVGVKVVDVGNDHLDPEDDFVDFAAIASQKIKEDDRGIFLCRNGVGVSIVGNRFSHIRAVLGFDYQQVKRAVVDDNCNVLCLPADYISQETAFELVEVFLNTEFSKEERYVRRLAKLDKLD